MKLNLSTANKPPSAKVGTILEELLTKSTELMDANDLLREYAEEDANAQNALGMAKAKAFLLASGKNKEERESMADAHFAEERHLALLAKGKKESQLERVRSLRQILSAFQTYVNSEKAVADMLTFGHNND